MFLKSFLPIIIFYIINLNLAVTLKREQNKSFETSQNWSFLAVIVYGTRVFCAGTVITEVWVVTLGHCVNDPIKSENEARFGQIKVRLGGEPIPYKVVKHVQLKNCSINDGEYFVPVVGNINLQEVLKIIVHPNYFYEENKFGLPYIGVDDLALVKFEKSQFYILPDVTKGPNFKGNCIAAGWALTISEKPALTHDIYELQVFIGTNRQCKRYFEISATQLPEELKIRYERNKICSLLSGGQPYTFGVEDGDEGGPLLCDGKIQGIISHYFKRSNGDHFSFFYDLGFYLDWIKNVTYEVKTLVVTQVPHDVPLRFSTMPITVHKPVTEHLFKIPQKLIKQSDLSDKVGNGNGDEDVSTSNETESNIKKKFEFIWIIFGHDVYKYIAIFILTLIIFIFAVWLFIAKIKGKSFRRKKRFQLRWNWLKDL